VLKELDPSSAYDWHRQEKVKWKDARLSSAGTLSSPEMAAPNDCRSSSI
jgi:hypothetical protein